MFFAATAEERDLWVNGLHSILKVPVTDPSFFPLLNMGLSDVAIKKDELLERYKQNLKILSKDNWQRMGQEQRSITNDYETSKDKAVQIKSGLRSFRSNDKQNKHKKYKHMRHHSEEHHISKV